MQFLSVARVFLPVFSSNEMSWRLCKKDPTLRTWATRGITIAPCSIFVDFHIAYYVMFDEVEGSGCCDNQRITLAYPNGKVCLSKDPQRILDPTYTVG
jgi:hypothetical protein